jgi:hypothetical protein
MSNPDLVATLNVWRSIAGPVLTNPLAPPDAPPRESIESRLLVFFD